MAQDKVRERAVRYKRRRQPPGIEIQLPRDLDILVALYRYRVLRQDQLQQLCFTSKERAQKRLRLLYDHRYIDRRFLAERIDGGGRKPNLYVLDRRGAELLTRERPELDVKWHHSAKDMSDNYLRHILPLNDIMVAAQIATRLFAYDIQDWQTEAQLKAQPDRVVINASSGKRVAVTVIPDTYFELVAVGRKYPCFVEYDGVTETSKVIKDKIRAYHAYYESGKYANRYGGRVSFRVLFVTPSAKRLQSLKTWTEELHIPGQQVFWFAHLAQLTPQSVFTEPIWHYAGGQEPRALVARV